MNCRQSEIVLESEEGNGPKEIHDTRDFGALSVKNGHHCTCLLHHKGPKGRKLSR